MTIASNHFQSVKMDIFKQNYINPGGFCNKKKIVVYVSLHLHLLICVLLVQQTNCSTCASPECLVGYDARTMPRPHTASGLCGRHCRYSWICDPCQILNSTAADEIDEMLFVVEPPKTICRNVREYRISLAIVNRMNLGNQTSQARTFARSLRKYEWNFETGSCGNNVVIFLSRYDRQKSFRRRKMLLWFMVNVMETPIANMLSSYRSVCDIWFVCEIWSVEF
ncbi:uncharacterized protein LOC127724693 isoform X8 [Mytilus californianus]|uniref:uncharacterized protein LOC127724693 isoform X8 n=1 Tax=Mytilus californianus TaxID=6549 RepID=UPI002245CAC6|nr:uncharacterized protein LOC127724693 isoform X8 [Mytilus californianus]